MSEEPQCKILLDGTKEWRLNDAFHRLDGPALERANGSKQWWFHGKIHRIDGPAVEFGDNIKVWYFNGKWLGYGDEGFWALWDLLDEEQRSDWKLLQWAPWVKS